MILVEIWGTQPKSNPCKLSLIQLKNYQALARTITVNAKGEALLKALEKDDAVIKWVRPPEGKIPIIIGDIPIHRIL